LAIYWPMINLLGMPDRVSYLCELWNLKNILELLYIFKVLDINLISLS